jgi:predicted alpha/beta-fold hydrolase
LGRYLPPPFISGKSRQLLFNVYVSKDKEIQIDFKRSLVKLDDGGQLSIDWAYPEHSTQRKVCVIFPGLSGGSDRGYCKSLVRTLLAKGYEVAVLHGRGMGNTEFTSIKFQDMTDTSDI